MSEFKNRSGDSGLVWILFFVFLILKLTGSVEWSWWLVTSPLWVPVGLVLIIHACVFVYALIVIAFRGK